MNPKDPHGWLRFQDGAVAWRASPTGLPVPMALAMRAADALQELVTRGDVDALENLARAAEAALVARKKRREGGRKSDDGAVLVRMVRPLLNVRNGGTVTRGDGASDEEIADRIIVRCTALKTLSAGPEGDPSVYSAPGLEARVARAVAKARNASTRRRPNGKDAAVIVQLALEAIGFGRDVARQATTRPPKV